MALMLSAALVLAACGTSSDDGSGAGARTTTAASSAAGQSGGGSSADLTTVKVGVVPTLSLGLLTVGEQQGYFEDEGLTLDITPVDSGPNVITGLVAGQYDLGYTAYAPPLVALAGGQPLRLVAPVDSHGANGTNGGVFVPKDSGITRWKDLEGKKLGTNAPRSLAVLWVQGAIASDGGDPSTLELVPLPFNQVAENVANGQLDAGITLEPYQSQGLAQFPDLVDLGDPAATFIPAGTPSGGVFTAEATLDAKADVIERFKRAFAKAVEYSNGHLDVVRTAGAELTGLSAENAAAIPLDQFETNVSAADFAPLVDAMQKYGWVQGQLDITEFIGDQ